MGPVAVAAFHPCSRQRAQGFRGLRVFGVLGDNSPDIASVLGPRMASRLGVAASGCLHDACWPPGDSTAGARKTAGRLGLAASEVYTGQSRNANRLRTDYEPTTSVQFLHASLLRSSRAT